MPENLYRHMHPLISSPKLTVEIFGGMVSKGHAREVLIWVEARDNPSL